MLQIRDLIWGLLFVGFAGKKLSSVVIHIWFCGDYFKACGQSKVCKNEGRAVLILEQHPLAALRRRHPRH